MTSLSEIPHSQKVTVLIAVMLAMFLGALDQTIVATAMPRIVDELNGLEHLSWVFTAYMLSSTIVVPIYGKLSDLYGRKPFILSAIAIFVLGSVLCGFAENMTQLIIFRAIQGIGGGAIFANAFAIIGDLFPPAERGKWQGMFGAVFGLSSVVGPLLGGWITDHASWRWNFFLNVPVGMVAFLAVSFLLPKIQSHFKKKSIDYIGAILLAIGLCLFLLACVWGGTEYAWDSWQIITLFATALVSLWSFAWVEQRVPEPILPLSLFKNSIFSVSMLIIFLSGMGMFGTILYIPLFAQLVQGQSATNSGTILMPLMLGIVTSAIFSGQIMARTGRYKWPAVAGLGLVTIAMFLLSQMTPEASARELMIKMILTGVGLGVTFPIFNLAVQNAFDHSKLGVATASTQLFRNIGATVGTAVLGGYLNNSLNNKLGDLSKDPFVQALSQRNPEFDGSHIDANKLQGILTGDTRHMIETQLASLPPAVKPQATAAFANFVERTKDIFSAAITEVFFLAIFIMGIAFIASFFLKEIPLRKTHKTPIEEAGM